MIIRLKEDLEGDRLLRLANVAKMRTGSFQGKVRLHCKAKPGQLLITHNC